MAAPSCSGFTTLTTVGANVTSFSNTSLSAETTYRYRVAAFNTDGDSGYSNTAEATTDAEPQPPAAPTSLNAATVSASRIDLTWTDNASNESGFRIERCTGSGCSSFTQIAEVGANVTSFSNTSLAANTTYTYRVRAFNGAGNSGYSNTAAATTNASAPQPPAAPSGLSASAAGGNVNLAWTDNSNNEDGFRIERCQGFFCSNFSQIAQVGAGITSYTDTSVSGGFNLYSYRVRAFNAAGNSGYSNTSSVFIF